MEQCKGPGFESQWGHNNIFALVVQLNRTPDYESGDWGLNPCESTNALVAQLASAVGF